MKWLLIIILWITATHLFSQIKNAPFQVLNLAYSARAVGLGTDFISVKDNDINMAIANPSLLNEGMMNHISFNTAFLSGKINYGVLSYGRHINRIGNAAGYIQYINYGKIKRTSITGEEEGSFNPIEFVIGGALSKEMNKRLSIGVKTNFIYSQMEQYNSLGASVDFSGTYFHEEKEFLVTILAKNIGYQLKGYTKQDKSLLPVEIQLATSYKLPHAPFRFSLLAHHLNQWDITYHDPNAKPEIDPLTGDTIPIKKAGFIEKLGRHFTYQVEILISKNIRLNAAFDYHQRKELALESRPGLAGFSFGAGFYFRKFNLIYGFKVYSRAGFNNMITLTTNLSEWKK